MKVTFCGAARTVTGSAHLIELEDGFKILLDCGLYQGYAEEMKTFNDNWLFDPAELDCLVLSHAHIDHTGRVPKLVKDGFHGKIHTTHATRSLCAIMLLDSAFIQERDAEYYNKKAVKKNKHAELREPLYTSEHVKQAMNLFTAYSYEKWFSIHPNVRVLFRDAGHILGSANVTLEITENGKTTTIGFSGDIGRPQRPILRDPAQMPEVDYMICESTYGDKDHPSKPDESDRLLAIIKETCLVNKGKLLIPAFSIGRTQEIVYMLDQMETAGILPRIPVYVDSPLAVNATTVFGSHPECYDNELNEYLLIDKNPFGFNNLHYIREVEESKHLNEVDGPCIIISASGMMNAGRIRHHLFNNIEDPKNTLLIVGYCAPNTTGGVLREGATEIKMFGDLKKVRMNVEIMDSFSAHADRMEMLDFLKNQKHIKTLFLVHGEIERQEKFSTLLQENGFKNVVIPVLGQSVELD
ncbi:MAG: MBL fold metallo-hydrolase [Saprospiraceae bacterium]|nr:MBL fold metallo-hydrolase [Saprospiraceae bacterium]